MDIAIALAVTGPWRGAARVARPEGMVARASLLLSSLGLLVACRGDGHRAGPGSGTSPAPPPVVSPTAPPPVADPPAVGTPAGSDALVPVPAAVAASLRLVPVLTNLARPVAVVAAPGDPRRRLFIVEQHTGRVRILEGGVLAPTPFLTVGGLSKGNEQGLLGLAFHPRFADTGRLYVNYTDADDATHIVEYRVAADSPDRVDPATRREIATIAQPYSNHNGGFLQFGPDGKLYTGMGDGGSAGDPQRNGQNPTALLGKILRFDVDAAAPTPELVHRGVRNPWRFWFDAEAGDLYIADVGQNAWESVFVVNGTDTTAKNFGWNVVEGNHCFGARTCDRTGFTPPVAEYSHDEGCSITGGVTYRGAALPALAGRYFYADFCTGLLRSFRWTSPGVVREHWDWKAALDPTGAVSQVSSFGVDHAGEVYLVALTGTIFKLVPST